MSDTVSERLAALNMLTNPKIQNKKLNMVLRPFNWPGSKSQSLPHLLRFVPYTRGYCELFGGSGVLLLNRRPSKFEVYNDVHSGLANFFLIARDKPNELSRRLGNEIYSREVFDTYRSTWRLQDDPVEKAARWYYTIALSFNQLGRYFGRPMKLNETPLSVRIDGLRETLGELSLRLKRVIIENKSSFDLLSEYDDPGMTFYLDPPYIETPNGTYTHNMKEADHIELLDRIFKLKGCVCLSGYYNDLIANRPWDAIEYWDVRDNMSSRSESEAHGHITDREYLYIKKANNG